VPLPDAATAEEHQLVAALRKGDERAFGRLVDLHHPAMVRLARTYVGSDAVAEEVVQEAWAALVRGIDRFEGRSSLKTWLFSIVKNRASSAYSRERRSLPLSALGPGEDEGAATVPAERFQTGTDPALAGRWASPPRPWEDGGRRLLSLELRGELRRGLEGLPRRQRLVVALRDVEGMEASEVCRLLDLSEENQRVLLHRGRACLRQALEDAFDGAAQPV